MIKQKLAGELSKTLQRDVSIQQIRINPYAMAIWVRGFLIKERQSPAAAISFDELYLNLELASLFRRGVVLKEVRLVKPHINLVRNEDFTYNFTDLINEFSKAEPKKPPGRMPRFSLNNIEIVDGRIDFHDRLQGVKHTASDIRVGVPFISSLPSYADITVEPAFSALINGTPLEIGGETKPFKDSRESTIHLDINKLNIPKYVEYSPVELNFKVPSGQLDAKLAASFRTGKDKPAVLAISGQVEIQDLAVEEPNETPILKLPALQVAIDAFEVFANRASFGSISARGPELRAVRNRNGLLNLASLVVLDQPSKGRRADSTQDAKPFAYEIAEILIDEGKLQFEDLTAARPFQKQLEDIHVAIKGLTTETGKTAQTEISFRSDTKERFSHSGTLRLTPLLAEGQFEVQDLELKALRPYYERAISAEIKEGRLDLSGKINFGQQGNEPGTKLSEMNVTIRSLRMDLAGEPEPLWRIPLLALKDTTIDVGKKTVVIGAFEARDASGFIHRETDGSLSYARLVKPQPAQKEAPKPQQEDAWRVDTKRVHLDRLRVVFEDRSLPLPSRLVVSELTARGYDLSNTKNRRGKAMLDARINDKGLLRLSGATGTNPVIMAFDVEGQAIELLPFQPYLQDQVNFLLTGGEMGGKGRLNFDASAEGPVKISYEGNLQIANFATVEKNASQDLLKWKSLALDGVHFSHAPMHLRIDEITLGGFNSRIVMGADGKINLQELIATQVDKQEEPDSKDTAQEKTAERAALAPTEERRVTIGKINLQGGEILFSDFFIKPNYSAHLTSVQGAVSELKPETPGDLSLDASLNGAAPVSIRGKINPLLKDLYLDIAAEAKEIEMSPFSPYSGKYVGYDIEKGKLSFDVKYKLENRKLSADNQIILNQLTFGEKVESPQATKLPVQLAVALLKDRNGVIDVNLPIGGSLDDPQFSVGGIVLRLVMSIITKAVTAPFAFLGAAVGGSAEELSYVEFDDGRDRLTAAGEAKLKTLSRAMADRPGLKLEINGRIDPVNDLEGLRKLSIETKVKAQKRKELVRQGTTPPP